MYWQLTAEGYVCTRHDARFALGDACELCATDPGDDHAAEHSGREVDRVLMARANSFRGHGVAFARKSRELLKDGMPNEMGSAAKLSAEAIKWHRLALELEDKVAQRDHDRELIAHEQDMSGKRSTH